MNTLTSRFFAIMALALLLGMTSPVSAQEKLAGLFSGQPDPFEVSKQNCIDKNKINSSCFTTNERSGEFPLQLIIDELNTTIEKLRRVNNWGKEVTPETIVPIGSTFAFG